MKGPGGPHTDGCKCPMCQGGGMCGMNGCHFNHGCWIHAVRWILGIVIIAIVFAMGLMIGELEGELGRSSGYRMMRDAVVLRRRLCGSDDAERHGPDAGCPGDSSGSCGESVVWCR